MDNTNLGWKNRKGTVIRLSEEGVGLEQLKCRTGSVKRKKI
jgi:hypothetical protein